MKSIQKIFDEKFKEIKRSSIGIYGTGNNARTILENVTGYYFVCLISLDHLYESIGGLPILPLEEAIKSIDVIVIAASFSVTSIIYNRIKDIVPDSISIYNMLGEKLSLSIHCGYDSYWNLGFDDLIAVIDNHNAVSFDIFDTLIMRDFLEPSDVFKMVSTKTGITVLPEGRTAAEKRLRVDGSEPKLYDIYSCCLNTHKNIVHTADELEQIETTIEYEHILPRNKMLEAFNYALSAGKRVFLTSDMYMNFADISQLLVKCNITGEYELIVSCEYDKSKFKGDLFNVLKEKASGMNLVHIGDDELVDKTRAEEQGIDAFLICSSYRILAMSNSSFVFDDIKTFDDKCYLGKYVSDKLNDPFSLYNSEGKLSISSYKDLAWLLFPITKLFVDFIISNSVEYDCLLFPSRDGYFLYDLYCEYKNNHPGNKLPKAEYIYSSRMSLSRAALKDSDTFDFLIHKLFGNLSKNVKSYIDDLFGVDLPMEFNESCKTLIKQFGKDQLLAKLHDCIPDMVDKLSETSGKYKDYLYLLGVTDCSRIAMIDIVSFGTQPFCLSKILGKNVDMISIGSTGVPNVFMKEESVRSIYGNVNEEVNGSIINNSDLSILHLLLEVIYSSKDGQFVRMENNGVPIFLEGSNYNAELLNGVQYELKKMFNEQNYSSYVFSPEFSHGMLRILRSNYSSIDGELKEKLIFSDPYDGGFATVNLADLL